MMMMMLIISKYVGIIRYRIQRAVDQPGKGQGPFFLSKIGDLNETDFAESGRKGITPFIHHQNVPMTLWARTSESSLSRNIRLDDFRPSSLLYNYAISPQLK